MATNLGSGTIDVANFGLIPEGSSPLYARIAEGIERYMKQNSPEEGTRLPTESQLSKHFEVSIITIRAALKQLVDLGLVERHQGTGTFVGGARNRTSTWAIGTLSDLAQFSQATEIDILYIGEAKLPEWAALELQARAGEKRFHVSVVRRREGRGCQLTEAYYPRDVGEQLAAADMKASLLRTHLIIGAVENITGQSVAVIRQTIKATSATKLIASTLQVPLRTPVLEIARISETETGRVLQVARSFYQTHDFGYAFDIHRK